MLPADRPKELLSAKTWSWLWWGGLLLLLVAMTRLYWQDSKHERLFHMYFEPTSLILEESTRALGTSDPSSKQSMLIYQQALSYQDAQNYTAALTAWRAYLAEESHSNSVTPYWYASVAAHQVGAVEEAAYFLNQIPPSIAPPIWNEQLQWHRALTALRQRDVSSAQQMLEFIRQAPKTIYGKELAPSLLEALRAM